MILRYTPQATDEPYIYRLTRPNEFSLHDGVCNTRHSRTFSISTSPSGQCILRQVVKLLRSDTYNLTKYPLPTPDTVLTGNTSSSGKSVSVSISKLTATL